MTSKDLSIEIRGEQQEVAVIRLTRGSQTQCHQRRLGSRRMRKACLKTCLTAFALPSLMAKGEHFCAGLDLSRAVKERDAGQGLLHSRMPGMPRWSACNTVRYRSLPHCTARWWAVAWSWPAPARSVWQTTPPSLHCPRARAAFSLEVVVRFAFPRLIGVARMTDMMLTGRVYNAADGERVGLAQYLVPKGSAFDKAFELARAHCDQNAPIDQLFALTHVLPRIADQPADQGFMTEAHDGRDCSERARSQETAYERSCRVARTRFRRPEYVAPRLVATRTALPPRGGPALTWGGPR
jgi:hypothetical protein